MITSSIATFCTLSFGAGINDSTLSIEDCKVAALETAQKLDLGAAVRDAALEYR